MTVKAPLHIMRPEPTRTIKTFTQRDIERAVRGARKGGLALGRVEISPTGSIVLWSVDQAPTESDGLERELLDWKKKRGTH